MHSYFASLLLVMTFDWLLIITVHVKENLVFEWLRESVRV